MDRKPTAVTRCASRRLNFGGFVIRGVATLTQLSPNVCRGSHIVISAKHHDLDLLCETNGECLRQCFQHGDRHTKWVEMCIQSACT
jgi:hypothetical protein